MGTLKKTSPSSLGPGDFVEIIYGETALHGDFIKRDPDNKLLIIKLKSGYDVAVPEKMVRGLKLIGKAKPLPKKTVKATKPFSGNEDLTIITTGGTIASKIDYKTGGVSPSTDPDYYFQLAPDLKNYGNVRIKDAMQILSENMLPSDWIKIGKAAYDSIKNGSKGVVVTMGTDTMHFASAAMSFILNPLSQTVVFTGAQRSSDRGSSDATVNLSLSALTAAKWGGGESVVCMHADLNDRCNFILRGTRVRKMHTERRDAFKPVNFPPLARVYLDGKIEEISRKIPKNSTTEINTKLDDRVGIITSYPGMDGGAIKYYLDKGVKGLVIAGTGFGNLPLKNKGVYQALETAHKKGVPIVVTSQTIYGSTNRFVYSTLRELSKFDNIIYVNDMLTETAFVKMMFALGRSKDMGEIRKFMMAPVAGEIGERETYGSGSV